MGWVSRPRAESDISIVDCYLAAAGDTGCDDADVAALQQWRRRHGAMWVSELLRADGRTPKHRFGHDLQRRIDNCEDGALRLCSIAFGSGLLKSPSVRPRVGRALRAAWGDVRAGEYIWHCGVLCEVQQLGSLTVSLLTYSCVEGTVWAQWRLLCGGRNCHGGGLARVWHCHVAVILGRAALERSDFAVRRLPLIFALK